VGQGESAHEDATGLELGGSDDDIGRPTVPQPSRFLQTSALHTLSRHGLPFQALYVPFAVTVTPQVQFILCIPDR
jgi:hypothetical protein